MIYFILSFALMMGFLLFTAIKGLNLKFRECASSLFSYTFFLLLLSIYVFIIKMNIVSFSLLLGLSGLVFSLAFSRKRLNLYIITLKSYYVLLVSFLITFTLSELILNSNLYILFNNRVNTMILFIISLLIYSVLECLLIWYLNCDKLEYLFSYLNSFIPISMFILLIGKSCSLVYVLVFSRHALIVTAVILASTLLEIYFGIFTIVGVSKAYKLSIYKHKNKILNLQYSLQMATLNQLEEYQCDIRRISHDINNHKTVMYKLISDGEYDDALKYLESYGNGFNTRSYEPLTNNKILNAIFLYKRDICNTNNIELKLDISVPKTFGVSDFDLCIIVGNLMDNAIEACKKVHSNPFIRVKCCILNDNFVLDIKNNFNENISEGFLTSKKDKLNHGLGISNVKSTVNKYSGTCLLSFEGDVFSSFIMIPVSLYITS